jgi:hypothetical protein
MCPMPVTVGLEHGEKNTDNKSKRYSISKRQDTGNLSKPRGRGQGRTLPLLCATNGRHHHRPIVI